MTHAKVIFVYTFLLIFAGTALTAFLGAFGVIPVSSGVTISAFIALTSECVPVFLAAFKSDNFFDDPPAVARLKETSEVEITRLKRQLEDAQTKIDKITASNTEEKARHKIELRDALASRSITGGNLAKLAQLQHELRDEQKPKQ